MRSSSNSRTPATDFVQDYAAKRQAQMDRARQLREERLQQQQQQQVSSPSGGDGASNIGSPAPMLTPLTGSPGSASSRPPPHVPRSRHPSSGHVHASAAAAAADEDDGRVLYVKESNFKQATQAGIITPDQARQLWAMLSNQIIRVCPPSGQGNSVSQTNNNTVSVSSLMALSHHSSASSSTGRNSASGNGGNFGASISLESLRNSIAFFKREQQRLKQQQQQQQQGNAALTRPASSSKVIAAAAPSAPSQQQHRSAYEMDEDEDEEVEFHEEADHYAEEEQRQRHQLRGGGGGGGRGSSRPAWNSDVEINYGNDATAASSSAGGVAARKKARTASTAKVTSAARPTVGAGGGGGSKANPSSASSDSAQVRNAGVGAGGRPQANRSAAANNNQNTSRGTPLNLDDVPVGGGGGGGMNDWANAYPPGMAPPDSRDGNKVSSSSGGAGFTVPAASENDVIAAEAAAAAREPMKECATCGRTFRVSVLARHEALCRKQANKPRKVFNTRDQRLDGVEGINEVQRAAPRNANANTRGGRGGGGGADAATKGKLPKWKVQHEQFQAAMRAVRQQNEGGGGRFGNGALAPPPAPVPEEYDDRVPCPHCGRKFAEEVAARHIPKCATTVAKPKGIRPIRR